MVQTRSNSGPVEDQALGQASGGDNRTAESSSCGTVPEVPQELARGDAPSVDVSVQLPSGQEALENPGAMGAGDPIKVDAPPGNEESGREDEDEIAAKIERLKKEQKKAQMRTKLRRLREHKA